MSACTWPDTGIAHTLSSELESSDKAVLMRAVAGIVLRKDLSLTRRLYTWLLGPDSSTAEIQKDFFTKNGLELLTLSLLVCDVRLHDMQLMWIQQGMVEVGDIALEAERPYKITIALLDKWEIGDALIPRLVIPMLTSLKDRQEQTKLDQVHAT